MKTTVLVALSFSLVACGGSLEGEHGSVALDRSSSREPRAFENPAGRNVVVRAGAAIEAARLEGQGVMLLNAETVEDARLEGQSVMMLNADTIEAARRDVLVLSVTVIESARNALLISASRPVTADTMLELSGVKKLNLACTSQSTGETTSSAHCTWADGRALSETELRALPEMLSFVGSLED